MIGVRSVKFVMIPTLRLLPDAAKLARPTTGGAPMRAATVKRAWGFNPVT